MDSVEEHYPFARGERMRRLIEAGEDALAGVADWGLDYDDGSGRYGYLTDQRYGATALRRALALEWRDLCDQRRTPVACTPPSKRLVRGRAGRRPRDRRSRRVASTARGPDDDGGGEPHHLTVTAGGRP